MIEETTQQPYGYLVTYKKSMSSPDMILTSKGGFEIYGKGETESEAKANAQEAMALLIGLAFLHKP